MKTSLLLMSLTIALTSTAYSQGNSTGTGNNSNPSATLTHRCQALDNNLRPTDGRIDIYSSSVAENIQGVTGAISNIRVVNIPQLEGVRISSEAGSERGIWDGNFISLDLTLRNGSANLGGTITTRAVPNDAMDVDYLRELGLMARLIALIDLEAPSRSRMDYKKRLDQAKLDFQLSTLILRPSGQNFFFQCRSASPSIQPSNRVNNSNRNSRPESSPTNLRRASPSRASRQ